MNSTDRTCDHCTYWDQGHDSFQQPDLYGQCNKLGEQVDPEYIIPVLNNGHPVTEQVNHYDYVTGAKFGCNHFDEK